LDVVIEGAGAVFPLVQEREGVPVGKVLELEGGRERGRGRKEKWTNTAFYIGQRREGWREGERKRREENTHTWRRTPSP